MAPLHRRRLGPHHTAGAGRRDAQTRALQVTRAQVVGRSNAGLMVEAFELLSTDDSIKIGLLGKGAYDRFEAICKEVLELLPHAEDKEESFRFKGGAYDNWEDFEQEVEDREMPYGTHLALIENFAKNGELPSLIESFRRGVLERRLPESECKVLLATACRGPKVWSGTTSRCSTTIRG